MRIGLAFDLRTEIARTHGESGPEDRLEEYDSQETVHAIAEALRADGHEPTLLGGGRAFLAQVLSEPPDLVFNIAEGWGTRSREAHVPAVCEMLGLPVTHSDPLTLALSLDKAMTKRVVASCGVPTPRFVAAAEPTDLSRLDFPFPVIAKPLCEGSSMGVRKGSRVTSAAALRDLCARLWADYDQPVLVEEFVSGPEVTVGVVGTGKTARVLGAMEIVPSTGRPEEFVYSLEVKRNWREEVAYHVPPRLPRTELEAIERTALGAYQALGCRDIARVDVRLDAARRAHFLEINPLPGINPVTGDIVILAGRLGVTYAELIRGIVASATARIAR